MIHPEPWKGQPAPLAARIALIAAVIGLLALLFTPLATLGRGFDASGVLVHLGGGISNLSAQSELRWPSLTPLLGLAWLSAGSLAFSALAAWRSQRWLWLSGLLAVSCALLAVWWLGQQLGHEVTRVLSDTTLRPGARRTLRNFYEGGGMNLGLFAASLSGLVIMAAGLSVQNWWAARFERLRGLLIPLVAISLATLVGAVVVLAVQRPVSHAPLSLWTSVLAHADLVYFVYSTLFAPITHLNPFLDSLKIATPLIFTGLSVAFAFRTGLFNIGAPGQLTIGAICAMLVGVYSPAGLGWLLLPLSVIAAGLGGALWGAIPGLLKARYGSSEVINTIMLNYIASGFFVFLIGSNAFPLFGKTYQLPFKAPGFEAQSAELQPAARLPTMLSLLNVGSGEQLALTLGPLFGLSAWGLAWFLLKRQPRRGWLALGAALLVTLLTWRIGVPVQLSGSQLNASFLIALAGVGFFSVLMWRTTTGYALRAVGLSPKAAEYGGISVARGTVLAMTFAGMFAGLAGTHYVLGGAMDAYRLKGNMPVSVGFDGIAVALMGQSTPLGVLASSVLFGTIDTGGVDADLKLNAINKDIVTVLKALIVLFIAAGGFLGRRFTEAKPEPPAPPAPTVPAPAQPHTNEV